MGPHRIIFRGNLQQFFYRLDTPLIIQQTAIKYSLHTKEVNNTWVELLEKFAAVPLVYSSTMFTKCEPCRRQQQQNIVQNIVHIVLIVNLRSYNFN